MAFVFLKLKFVVLCLCAVDKLVYIVRFYANISDAQMTTTEIFGHVFHYVIFHVNYKSTHLSACLSFKFKYNAKGTLHFTFTIIIDFGFPIS